LVIDQFTILKATVKVTQVDKKIHYVEKGISHSSPIHQIIHATITFDRKNQLSSSLHYSVRKAYALDVGLGAKPERIPWHFE
jgi:hypothetical protein